MKDYLTLDEMLFELGKDKQNGGDVTWSEIAEAVNERFGETHGANWYHKRYRRLENALNYQPPLAYDPDLPIAMKVHVQELEKQRARIRQEVKEYRAVMKTELTLDALTEEMRSLMTSPDGEHVPDARNGNNGPVRVFGDENKAELKEASPAAEDMMNAALRDSADNGKVLPEKGQKAVYALLGDIHYGLSFSHFYDSYSPAIAEARVMKYAHEVVEIGRRNNTKICYVTLLGDLISGCAHKTIQLENSKPVAAQLKGVTRMVYEFLKVLSAYFDEVNVNAVDGNHSRLDPTPETALRFDRLDKVILEHCRDIVEVGGLKNVRFSDNLYDASIADFTIFGKTYIAVHGDFDAKRSESAMRIQELIGKKVDVFLMGHIHVPEMRVENTMYIRNGAIVSGGDDYTAKRRLFGPAMQICMTVNENGVESVCPVRL